MATQAVKIFYCYARKDKELRDELEKHLRALERSGEIISWYDREILPGAEWKREIDRHLDTSDLILLLISSDFIDSDYCYGVEMGRALERHEAGVTHVIPVILRTCSWQTLPVRDLQALPEDGKPITTWHDRDEAFENVVVGVRRVVQRLFAQKVEQERDVEYKTTHQLWQKRESPAQTNTDHSFPTQRMEISGEAEPMRVQAPAQESVPGASPPPALQRKLFTRGVLLALVLLLIGGSSGYFAITSAEQARREQCAQNYQKAVALNGMQFGFNPQHTGENPYECILNARNVSQVTLLWSHSTKAPINFSSPVVANGIVYVVSTDGYLYAFDTSCRRKDCDPLWSFQIHGAISSPEVDDGTVYVGSNDGLYAFSANCRQACTPLTIFSASDIGLIHSSPTPDNVLNLVYVGTTSGLYVFTSNCREQSCELWTHYNKTGVITSSPAVANGVVYVGSYDHNLYAFDTACLLQRCTNPVLWSYTTGAQVVSSPAIANGMVYVGSYDKYFYAFDASCRKDCTPLWRYRVNGSIQSSPAVANGMVYVGSYDQYFYAFDASCRKDCTRLWRYHANSGIEGSPTVANGVVYIGSYDHQLYAFDTACRRDCKPVATLLTSGAITGTPAVVNGVIYIGSEDNTLYAFGLP